MRISTNYVKFSVILYKFLQETIKFYFFVNFWIFKNYTVFRDFKNQFLKIKVLRFLRTFVNFDVCFQFCGCPKIFTIFRDTFTTLVKMLTVKVELRLHKRPIDYITIKVNFHFYFFRHRFLEGSKVWLQTSVQNLTHWERGSSPVRFLILFGDLHSI